MTAARNRVPPWCLLLCALGAVMNGCDRGNRGPEEQPPVETGFDSPAAQAIRLVVAAEPAGMNPLAGKRRGQVDLWRQLYPSLLRGRSGPALTVDYRGDLARSWKWDRNALLCTLHLDRLWEDSVRISVADVLRSYEAYAAMGWMPQSAPPDSLEDPGLIRVAAVNDSTVRMTFRAGFPWWKGMDAATWPILPAHRLGRVDRTLLEASPIASNPLSGGPFRLQEWLPGMPLVLVDNPRAAATPGRPAERVIVETCPGLDTRVLRVASGRADIVLDVPVFRLQLLLEGLTSIRAQRAGYASVEMVLWNLGLPAASPEVREAVCLAVDRETMVEELLTWRDASFGIPAEGVLEPAGPVDADPGLRDSLLALGPLSRHDPGAAAALLERSGWTAADERGRPRTREGVPLRIEVLYERGYELREHLVSMLEADLHRIGITVIPIPLDSREFWSRFRSGDFEAVIMGFRVPPTPDLADLWGSRGIWNRGGYRSTRLDSLMEGQRSARDAGELARRSRWIEAQVRRDRPATLLVARERLDLLSPRVRGFTGTVWNPLGDLERTRLEQAQ